MRNEHATKGNDTLNLRACSKSMVTIATLCNDLLSTAEEVGSGVAYVVLLSVVTPPRRHPPQQMQGAALFGGQRFEVISTRAVAGSRPSW